MNAPRMLVAGVGNVFLGDDGFGVEVACRLARGPLPADVRVVDFGIRGIDLVYALLDPYDAVLLIDITRRGCAPGTLYVIEPTLVDGPAAPTDDLLASGHELDPGRVLRLARTLGADLRCVLLLGCEPAAFEGSDFGADGFSPHVAAAVDQAVALARSLIEDLRQRGTEHGRA
ncbi:peptidase M52 [Sorangium cellulosum]|uniref:Peptidase M52 n=1 Tax=Sorangium cellulosum TaxID=56 RepID=A0A2L0F5I5_SORCE|nr:hydrogenase maturation protease [Sorangium cellulosum]AUX46844.1 peptidase M52 [Sorangium cellulosum]